MIYLHFASGSPRIAKKAQYFCQYRFNPIIYERQIFYIDEKEPFITIGENMCCLRKTRDKECEKPLSTSKYL